MNWSGKCHGKSGKGEMEMGRTLSDAGRRKTDKSYSKIEAKRKNGKPPTRWVDDISQKVEVGFSEHNAHSSRPLISGVNPLSGNLPWGFVCKVEPEEDVRFNRDLIDVNAKFVGVVRYWW
ncbi:hypothetical protein Trydic_g23705 [Trypoxylus dichotomus]